MLRKGLPYLLTLLLLLTAGAGESPAQSVAAGALLSPKGSGVAFRLDRGALLYDFALTADFYGVLRQGARPGYAFSFYANPVLSRSQPHPELLVRVFAGPGIGTGWVADRGGHGFGLAATLNADFGVSFDFARQLSTTLGFQAGLGLHATGKSLQGSVVRLYRNGLVRSFYPEARILYRFHEGKTARNATVNTDKSIIYGIETSLYPLYSASRDVDFRVEDGFRVHDRLRECPGRATGEILAFVGYRFTPAFSLSFYAGYAGEYRDTRMFPLSLRGTVYGGRPGRQGGILGFLDGGIALSEKHDVALGWVGKSGLGWRFFVGGGCALDLLASVRVGFLHPYLYDPHSAHRIAAGHIFRNNAVVISPGLSLALTL